MTEERIKDLQEIFGIDTSGGNTTAIFGEVITFIDLLLQEEGEKALGILRDLRQELKEAQHQRNDGDPYDGLIISVDESIQKLSKLTAKGE